MHGSLFRMAPGCFVFAPPSENRFGENTRANRAFVTVMWVARSQKRAERIGHRGPNGIAMSFLGSRGSYSTFFSDANRRQPERGAMNPYGGCRVPIGGT